VVVVQTLHRLELVAQVVAAMVQLPQMQQQVLLTLAVVVVVFGVQVTQAVLAVQVLL
jgi:hypothetical protein